jgi:hypothetical protein
MRIHSTPAPGARLLALVRAGFVAKGTSFTRWCIENDVTRQNARTALLGGWNGPKAQALRARIVAASTTAELKKAA